MQIRHTPYVHPYKTIAINQRTPIGKDLVYNLPENFCSGYGKIIMTNDAYNNLKAIRADQTNLDYYRTNFKTRYIQYTDYRFNEGDFFPIKTETGEIYGDYMYLTDTSIISSTYYAGTFKWGQDINVLVDGIRQGGITAVLFDIPAGTQTISLTFDLGKNNPVIVSGMELSVIKEKEMYNDPNILYDSNGIPKPSAHKMLIDSVEKVPVSWTSEDNVYESPIIASTDLTVMIKDKTRSFLLDPITKEYRDIVSPFTDIIAGDSSRFYAIDNYLVYEFDEIEGNWLPNGMTVSFEPNFHTSANQAIFAFFPNNIMSGKTVTLDENNSVNITVNTITGTIEGTSINYSANNILAGSEFRYIAAQENSLDILLKTANGKLQYVRITKNGYKIFPNVCLPNYVFNDTQVYYICLENGVRTTLKDNLKNEIMPITFFNSELEETFFQVGILDAQKDDVYFVAVVPHDDNYEINLYFAKTIYNNNYIVETEPIILDKPIKIQKIEKGYSSNIYVKDELGNTYYEENYFTPKGLTTLVPKPFDKEQVALSFSISQNSMIFVDAFGGSDTTGNGTEENPYQTLDFAVTKGDYIFLFPGKYNISNIFIGSKYYYAIIPNTVLIVTNALPASDAFNYHNRFYNLLFCAKTFSTHSEVHSNSWLPPGVYPILQGYNSLLSLMLVSDRYLFTNNVKLQRRNYQTVWLDKNNTTFYFDIVFYETYNQIRFNNSQEITVGVSGVTEQIDIPKTFIPKLLYYGYVPGYETLTIPNPDEVLYDEVVFVKDGKVLESQGIQTNSFKIVREFKSINNITWSINNNTESPQTVDALLDISTLHELQGFDPNQDGIKFSFNESEISAKIINWFGERKIYIPNITLDVGVNVLKYISSETNTIESFDDKLLELYKFEDSVVGVNNSSNITPTKEPVYEKKGIRIDDNVLTINDVAPNTVLVFDFLGIGLGGDRQIVKTRFLQDIVGGTNELWIPIEVTDRTWDDTILAEKDIHHIKLTKNGETLDAILLMYDFNKKRAKWLVNLSTTNNPFVLAQADQEVVIVFEYDENYQIDLSKSPTMYMNPALGNQYYYGGVNQKTADYVQTNTLVRNGLYNMDFMVNGIGTGSTWTLVALAGTQHKTNDAVEKTLFSISNKIKFNSTQNGFKCYVKTESMGTADFTSTSHPWEANNAYNIRAIGVYYEPTTNNIFVLMDGNNNPVSFLNNIGNTMALTGTEKFAFGGNIFDTANVVWTNQTELLKEVLFFNYQLTKQQIAGLGLLDKQESNIGFNFLTGNKITEDITSVGDLITIAGKRIVEADLDGDVILSQTGEIISGSPLNFQNLILEIGSGQIKVFHPLTLEYETVDVSLEDTYDIKIGKNSLGYLILNDLMVFDNTISKNLLKYFGGKFL